MQKERVRFTFKGIIQGVGFRPAVYRAAVSLNLSGYVQNRRSEVVAEVEGDKEIVLCFLETFKKILPKASSLTEIREEKVPLKGDFEFKIVPSISTDFTFPPIPPDLSICPECSTELFDPENRRFLYPFITCTQCGPRYSIVEETPFDRETTSMIDFPQCPDCLSEYTNPLDRRFHSQTNSCSKCGPELLFKRANGGPVPGDPLLNTIKALSAGSIVAIKGIGGFHIALDPRFMDKIKRLRTEKERAKKPFALMVRNLETARSLCSLTKKEEDILTSVERPVIIAPVKENIPGYLADVSDTGTLGIMLPYTPLHLLLFSHPETSIPYTHLVMTSGNWRGEPIITEEKEITEKLAETVDYVLYNTRRIIFRNDDSVLRTFSDNSDILIRRSRGYVPKTITVSPPLKKITIAAGGDLKSAPAFAKGKDIYLSPYIGDLENPAAFLVYKEQIDKILKLYNVIPERIVSDLHPLYLSSKWADHQTGVEKLKVQHHHAHILSVMAEHNLDECLGLAFDGTGYGTDGTIWGGEFLHVKRSSFVRLGRFSPFPLPGGENAVLNPLRIAFSILKSAGSTNENHISRFLNPEKIELLEEMLSKGVNSPQTSSLGRIFDAASAILGLVKKVSYEGEGPIKMEGLALSAFKKSPDIHSKVSQLSFCYSPKDSLFEINCAPLLLFLAERVKKQSIPDLSLFFHKEIAAAAMEGAAKMRVITGLKSIALSGGVFQNVLLLSLLVPNLKKEGFNVYLNRQVSPGDGGIALGQVYAL